jgi:hypothetical protein
MQNTLALPVHAMRKQCLERLLPKPQSHRCPSRDKSTSALKTQEGLQVLELPQERLVC